MLATHVLKSFCPATCVSAAATQRAARQALPVWWPQRPSRSSSCYHLYPSPHQAKEAITSTSGSLITLGTTNLLGYSILSGNTWQSLGKLRSVDKSPQSVKWLVESKERLTSWRLGVLLRKLLEDASSTQSQQAVGGLKVPKLRASPREMLDLKYEFWAYLGQSAGNPCLFLRAGSSFQGSWLSKVDVPLPTTVM